MGAKKGYKGESCYEAIRESIAADEVVSCSALYQRVKSRGEWSDDTIWLHFIASTVNCVPARHRWSIETTFFLCAPTGDASCMTKENIRA